MTSNLNGRPTAAWSTSFFFAAQGHADSQFAQPLAHRVGGHAEDTGNGKHCAQYAITPSARVAIREGT